MTFVRMLLSVSDIGLLGNTDYWVSFITVKTFCFLGYLPMCLCIRVSSRYKFVNTISYKRLVEIHNLGAVGDKDELIRFKVKRS